LFVGLFLAALGGFGAFHFGHRLEQEKEKQRTADVRKLSELVNTLQDERRTLRQQVAAPEKSEPQTPPVAEGPPPSASPAVAPAPSPPASPPPGGRPGPAPAPPPPSSPTPSPGGAQAAPGPTVSQPPPGPESRSLGSRRYGRRRRAERRSLDRPRKARPPCPS